MIKVFIDGSEGTTGLRIAERLKKRSDIELITIPEEYRKDAVERAKRINASDVTFLCLPDVAAKEAVTLVDNEKVRIIDASTAHRTEQGWVYGLAELGKENRNAIANGKRVAVPGCHAGGFVTLVYPLVKKGVIKPTDEISCYSLTGYSGGGKKMIAEYESENRSRLLSSPRAYGLTQAHKHLKEMKFICSLAKSPVFVPVVCDFYSGMEVTVPLFGVNPDEIRALYQDFYKDQKLIKVVPKDNETTASFLPANLLEGRDDLRIVVSGNDECVTVTALFDNLGKGASGSAIEIMNIMFGLDETTGLEYSEEII